MSVYYAPTPEHENLIRASLRVIEGTHYARPEDPHADAEQQYGEEQLALAAQALTEAVHRKPADEQPVGWTPKSSPDAARVAELEGLLECLASPDPCVWQGQVCVTHSWDSDIGLCPHGQAQALLGGGQ